MGFAADKKTFFFFRRYSYLDSLMHPPLVEREPVDIGEGLPTLIAYVGTLVVVDDGDVLLQSPLIGCGKVAQAAGVRLGLLVDGKIVPFKVKLPPAEKKFLQTKTKGRRNYGNLREHSLANITLVSLPLHRDPLVAHQNVSGQSALKMKEQ